MSNPKQVRLSDTTVIGLHLDHAEVISSTTKQSGTIIALADLPRWRGWGVAKQVIEYVYRNLRDVV